MAISLYLLYHHLYSAETKICKYCPSECCVLQERCTEWIECSRPGENDWDCNFIFYQPRYAGLLFLCQECTVCNQGERKSSRWYILNLSTWFKYAGFCQRGDGKGQRARCGKDEDRESISRFSPHVGCAGHEEKQSETRSGLGTIRPWQMLRFLRQNILGGRDLDISGPFWVCHNFLRRHNWVQRACVWLHRQWGETKLRTWCRSGVSESVSPLLVRSLWLLRRTLNTSRQRDSLNCCCLPNYS